MNNKWIDKTSLDFMQNMINPNLFKWLSLPQNLTETIKQTGVTFSLNLVDQSVANPYPDEVNAFKNYPHASYYLVRKVFLQGDEHPMVFARVIVPDTTYESYKTEFDTLGCSPIGNALLYPNEQVKRSHFEYKLIEEQDEVYQELNQQQQQQQMDKENTWARRSMFFFPKGPILISEVFLTAIPQYPSQS